MELFNEYNLIRSKRKTVSITITKDVRILVRAPLKLSLKTIDKIVQDKEDWIVKNTELVIKRKEHADAVKEKAKGSVLFMGKLYTIIPSDKINTVIFEQDTILIPFKHYNDSVYLEKWYKSQAKQILVERLAEISGITGIPFEGCRITGAKKRWGSCNSKNNINFAWRLILADQKAIDYVIVHELCHIKHKNHSKYFWNLVEIYMPDFVRWQRWLKDNSYILDII